MNYNEISFRELLSSSIFTLQIHSLTPPLCQELNWVTRIPYPIASSREFRLHVLPVILPACLLTTQHLPSLSHAPSAVTPIHNPSSHSTCVLSHFSHVQLFVTPWTVACQALLSMGFSRQEYWSGLPSPPPLIALSQHLPYWILSV